MWGFVSCLATPSGAVSAGLRPPGYLSCLERSLQVTALLELVKSSSESSSEAAALYYDELSNLIASATLDPQVQVCLHKPFLF